MLPLVFGFIVNFFIISLFIILYLGYIWDICQLLLYSFFIVMIMIYDVAEISSTKMRLYIFPKMFLVACFIFLIKLVWPKKIPVQAHCI